MSKKEIVILAILGALIVFAAVAIGAATELNQPDVIINPFVPPAFDPAAQLGEPVDLPADLGYGTLALREDALVAICANVSVEEDAALLYLTSKSTNVGWIRVKLLDASGNLLGESGLLRPGEYVRSVALSTVPAPDTLVTVKILVYEPDTYISIGSASAQVCIVAE